MGQGQASAANTDHAGKKLRNNLSSSSESERKRPPKNWEGAVDKTIREAIERGEFANLAGKGKPIDLGDNPFTPADMQLAYKVLKDAGVTLVWIEEGKEILAEQERLGTLLRVEARIQRASKKNRGSLTPDRIIADYKEMQSRRERTAAQYRLRAQALNRKIDTYNLQVPNSRLQQPRLRIEEEIEKFLEECG